MALTSLVFFFSKLDFRIFEPSVYYVISYLFKLQNISLPNWTLPIFYFLKSSRSSTVYVLNPDTIEFLFSYDLAFFPQLDFSKLKALPKFKILFSKIPTSSNCKISKTGLFLILISLIEVFLDIFGLIQI